MFRTGTGFDVHRLSEGYDLWIGGVKIDYVKGSVGHSDGDVLLHAICDALLGAANLGDIGTHFPDTDPAYKGISSVVLLEKTVAMVSGKGYTISNIDSTLILQKPRIAGHTGKMREIIATAAGIEPDRVSIKATTTETLGFTGRGEGIAAQASVLIYKKG